MAPVAAEPCVDYSMSSHTVCGHMKHIRQWSNHYAVPQQAIVKLLFDRVCVSCDTCEICILTWAQWCNDY